MTKSAVLAGFPGYSIQLDAAADGVWLFIRDVSGSIVGCGKAESTAESISTKRDALLTTLRSNIAAVEAFSL